MSGGFLFAKIGPVLLDSDTLAILTRSFIFIDRRAIRQMTALKRAPTCRLL
jgi:hypothetical protein